MFKFPNASLYEELTSCHLKYIYDLLKKKTHPNTNSVLSVGTKKTHTVKILMRAWKGGIALFLECSLGVSLVWQTTGM